MTYIDLYIVPPPKRLQFSIFLAMHCFLNLDQFFVVSLLQKINIFIISFSELNHMILFRVIIYISFSQFLSDRQKYYDVLSLMKIGHEFHILPEFLLFQK